MIVKCEQCQTRFKIPDEKVTDKGVKVRCTKCGHTFRVTRESAASASGTPVPLPSAPAPAPSGGGFDPFERFGSAPEPPKGVHTTRPGFFAEGVEASRTQPLGAAAPPAPWNSADSGVEEDAFQETTRVMPLQVPVEARPPVPSLPPLPFDLPPVTAPAGALRPTTPTSGQGLPGPGAVSFKPQASSPGPMPGVPSIAPPVSPVPSRSQPTPPPVKSTAPGVLKPAGGAAPRSLAPPAVPVPTSPTSAPVNSARPAAKPAALAPASAPAPATVPGAADLFSEFFSNPAGGPLPAAPLPDLPSPGLPPVAAAPAPASVRAPAPAPVRPPTSAPMFAPSDDPFGSVGGDLGEPPPDLGPAPEFDPMAMFADASPAPAPAPVAPVVAAAPRPVTLPPVPAVANRPLPVPTTSAPPSSGRPLSMPPAVAPPVSRLAPVSSAPMAPAPAPRLAPAAMQPAPAPAPAPFPEDDPFGPSNADLSEPPSEFGFDPPAAPAPAPMFAAPAPVAAPAPLSFSDEDPFGSAGSDLSGAPEEQAAPGPDPFAPPGPDPFAPPGPDPFAPPAPMAAAPGLEEFGPSFGAPVPQEQAAPSAPAPAFVPPGPMDFGMLGDEQMPPGSDPMGAPGGMPDPFAPPGGGQDPFAAQAADPFAAQAAGEGMQDPFAAQAAEQGMQDPFAAQAAGQGMQDPFAAQAAGQGMQDPFATAEPAFSPTATGRHKLGSGSPSEGYLTQTDTSHQVISPTDTGRQLLDIPQHGNAQPQPGEEFGAQSSQELIDLPSQPEAPPPAAKPPPTLASPAIARPVGRPADMGIPERRKPTAAQQVTGQVAYLTIAAGLLLALTAVGGVYMKEGRVDAAALSPGHLMQLLTPSEFVARNVTNGLYDTRGGGSIFYVRGEVENRSAKPVRVKVVAALYDGDQRVKSAEGLAGMVPSPEDLNAVTSAETAAELRTRLDAGATVVPPGGRAPFTVVFQEYPQDLSAFRLQVTMEPAPEGGSKP